MPVDYDRELYRRYGAGIGCKKLQGTAMLNTKQRRFVQALLTNSTIVGAAAVAGICERTGHNYLKLPEVRAAIREAQTTAMQAAAAAAAGLSGEAVGVLRDLSQSGESEQVRLGAARALLGYGARAYDQMGIARQLAELEARLSI